MIKAAGIMFLTPDGQALFLKRGPGSDHPLEWAWPGGQLEPEESILDCAIRECLEETGYEVKPGDMELWTRSIAPAEEVALPLQEPPAVPGADVAGPTEEPGAVAPVLSSEPVDFTTYLARIKEPFVPHKCDEHTGWAWASVNAPPEPLHPGCRIAVERLTMHEMDIARAMAAGRLTSPQVYHNVTLWAMRITGTGVAYRKGLDEFSWRNPGVFLSEDFLSRCNGLTVIMEHPNSDTMDSDEFADRVIGSVVLPYVNTEKAEAWGIVKCYDDAANKLMADEQVSTSPCVVFYDPASTKKFTMDDGATLLIEGVPQLLDHLAVCPAGVWDKGGAPEGVKLDSHEPGDSNQDQLRQLRYGLMLLNARLGNLQATA